MSIRLNKFIFPVLLMLFALSSSVSAIENSIVFPATPPDYSGKFEDRTALTGNWDGLRTHMAEKGLIVSIDTTASYQDVLDGGIREKGETGGSSDMDLRMDFEKMGLWRGGFVQLFAETQYGDFINSYTGTMTGANTDGLFPLADENETTLTSAAYYHFLSDNFCLFAGKLETLDRDSNAMAGGRGKTQFLHQNLVFNPVTSLTVPYSALGGGLSLITTQDRDVLSLTVLDPNGQPNEAGFNDAFDGGATFMMEFKTNLFTSEATSHELFGFTYGTKNYPEVSNVEGEPVKTQDAWCVYFNYDQLLFDEKEYPGQGFGYFLRIGYGDEDTNPIEWFYSFGLCAKALIESRSNDTCGIGYYYSGISDQYPWYYLDDEQGFEIYYNIEATPWLHITPDIQVIDQSDNFVETAIVAGVRVKIDI